MRLPEERPDDPQWSAVREHDVLELWDASRSPHVASSYAARLRHLVHLVEEAGGRGCRVLDVGCAQGTLGLTLAERGFDVTLLDVRARYLDYARARHARGRVQFCVGLLGPESPRETDFDVVLCTEVVEHVTAPSRSLLPELAAKVRAEGALILTTPNADCVTLGLPSFGSAPQSVIDEMEDHSADGDSHRALYTREELVTLVRSIGLRIEHIGFWLPFWQEGHLKTRYLHRAHYRLWKKPIEASLRELPAPLARRVCTSHWVVARKHA